MLKRFVPFAVLVMAAISVFLSTPQASAFSFTSGELSEEELATCKFVENSIENMLVDSLLNDRHDQTDGIYNSPYGNIYGGLVSRWPILMMNLFNLHNNLGCNADALVAVLEKVPTTHDMGETLKFFDDYFDEEKGYYVIPDMVTKEAANPEPNAKEANPTSAEVVSEETKLDPATQASLPTFREGSEIGDYTSVTENLGWRVEEDYLASTIVPHPSRQLIVMLGCTFRVVNAEGKLVNSIDIDGCANRAAAFSDDGNLIAYQNDGKITIGRWVDTDIKDTFTCNGHTRMILSMKFSGNGKQELYTASDDGTTRVWGIENGKCSELKRYRFGGYNVALTKDGYAYHNNILTNEILKIDLNSGEKTIIKSNVDLSTIRIMYNDNTGQIFAAGGAESEKSEIFEIDLSTSGLNFFKEAGSRVGSAFSDGHMMAISDDGRIIAYISGYSGNTVYLIDTIKREEILQFEGISSDASHIAFIPGSYDFVVGNSGSFNGEAIYWTLDFKTDL